MADSCRRQRKVLKRRPGYNRSSDTVRWSFVLGARDTPARLSFVTALQGLLALRCLHALAPVR